MRTVIFFVLSLVVISGCSSSSESEGVTEEDCKSVLEHTADLRLASVRSKLPSDKADAELEKHRANFAAAGGQQYLTQCAKSRSPKWIACSLDATSLQDIQACDK